MRADAGEVVRGVVGIALAAALTVGLLGVVAVEFEGSFEKVELARTHQRHGVVIVESAACFEVVACESNGAKSGAVAN